MKSAWSSQNFVKQIKSNKYIWEKMCVEREEEENAAT